MESKNNDPAGRGSRGSMADSAEDLPSRAASLSSGSSLEDMIVSDDESGRRSGRPQRSCQKYNLRRSSIRVRVQTEEKKQQPKAKKAKSRPPPLSKYRRRSANARERLRMAEINDAFEALKQALPEHGLETETLDGLNSSTGSSSPSSSSAGNSIAGNSIAGNSIAGGSIAGSSSVGDKNNNNSKCSKAQPTKIAVLRLAINYIAALRDILGYNVDSSSRSSSTVSSYGSNHSSSGSGGGGDHLHDDLGSDAASTSAPSTSSGDEESLLSSEDLDLASTMEDLSFLASSLGEDFSPDLAPDFTATLSREEEMCLELVASVL